MIVTSRDAQNFSREFDLRGDGTGIANDLILDNFEVLAGLVRPMLTPLSSPDRIKAPTLGGNHREVVSAVNLNWLLVRDQDLYRGVNVRLADRSPNYAFPVFAPVPSGE